MAADSPTGSPVRPRVLHPLRAERLMQVLLWGLIVLGPLVAGVALIETGALRNQIAGVAAPVEIPMDTALVEGLAEIAVSDHLSTATGGMWRVDATASLGAAELTDGYVAVTVTATVTPITPDNENTADAETPSDSRRLVFTVGMTETASGWAPVGTPSLVAAPLPAPVEVTARGRRLDDIAGLSESVSRFLVAYLTGDGELARYTAPGSDLVAVSPPPFVTVEITDAATTRLPDDTQRVTLTVVGVDAGGRGLPVGYWLVVSEREGRWEVSELLPAPPVEVVEVASEGGS